MESDHNGFETLKKKALKMSVEKSHDMKEWVIEKGRGSDANDDIETTVSAQCKNCSAKLFVDISHPPHRDINGYASIIECSDMKIRDITKEYNEAGN